MSLPSRATKRSKWPRSRNPGVTCVKPKVALTSAYTPLLQLERRMSEVVSGQGVTVNGLLILMRGLPGSGKTRLANRLASCYPSMTSVVSLDNHFGKWLPGTSPAPTASDLADAQAACKQLGTFYPANVYLSSICSYVTDPWSAMQNGVRFVIVDNENLRYSDMLPYASEALKNNYEVHFLEPDNQWRYSSRALSRKNRRGLTEKQMESLLEQFERFCTAEDFVAALASRKSTSCKTPKVSLQNDFQLQNNVSFDQEPPIRTDPGDVMSPNDLTASLLKSLRVADSEDSSIQVNGWSQPQTPTDGVLEQLQEMFPHLHLSFLQELVNLTDGDFEYAAAIAAENEHQPVLEACEKRGVLPLNPPTSVDDSNPDEPEKLPGEDGLADNVPVLVPTKPPEKKFQVEKEFPPIQLSRRFLKSTYDLYAVELGLPKLMIGSAVSAHLIGQINVNNPNTPDLESVIIEESAVRLSVEEQRKHFEMPHAQEALQTLVQQHPGIDREIIMETLVRCGYDFDAATACLVAGILDMTSFSEASSTSEFKASSSKFVAKPAGEQTPQKPNEENLSLKEILEEGQAIRRSVADQAKNTQKLAVQLTLHRLAGRFPSFTKPYLVELLVQFDYDEEKLLNYLETEGYDPLPVPPLIPQATTDGRTTSNNSTILPVDDAMQSLQLLEAEIADIRENMSNLKDIMSKAYRTHSHPGVIAFYNDELRKLRLRLDHRLDLCSDLRVTIGSQKHAAENSNAEKQDSRGVARQWLSFIDLHGLDLRRAMHALRRRLTLLESSHAPPGTPLPPGGQTLPNSWLPKRLTIVTGWGSKALSLANQKPYSILRQNVLNYLRTSGYSFVETPYLGCGCFEVQLGTRKRQL
ncbi:unnamed protein product [Mesocestoides corti]|uniref:Smr domain-containing protein n=1 Tax=Mesocestoides corti TaxID=53468 RepID=A0A158QSM4_MESCO|nr:unnamed protein product [Mesocestoides corti]